MIYMMLKVRVTPNSKADSVSLAADGTCKVKLRAKPIRGAANEALIEVLSEHFKVKPSAIRIRAGHASRDKLVEVAGV